MSLKIEYFLYQYFAFIPTILPKRLLSQSTVTPVLPNSVVTSQPCQKWPDLLEAVERAFCLLESSFASCPRDTALSSFSPYFSDGFFPSVLLPKFSAPGRLLVSIPGCALLPQFPHPAPGSEEHLCANIATVLIRVLNFPSDSRALPPTGCLHVDVLQPLPSRSLASQSPSRITYFHQGKC